jgi:hypothetical protein
MLDADRRIRRIESRRSFVANIALFEKTAVMGILERGGKIKTVVVPN